MATIGRYTMKNIVAFLFLISIVVVVVFFVLVINEKNKNQAPTIYIKRNKSGGYNANTLPPFGIVVNEKEKDNTALLHHELIHWEQYQREGLARYYFNYLIESLLHGYDGNKYEIEARANETGYCKKNYTECVRTGKATTVYNPDFRSYFTKVI